MIYVRLVKRPEKHMPRPTTYKPTISLCLTNLRLANLRLDMTGDCAYYMMKGGERL